jgi:hypothetical protein
MKRERCQRCGMEVAGAGHKTAEDCLTHLVPRYALAQRALESMHARFRVLEEKYERARIQLRVQAKAVKRAERFEQRTVGRRLERLERMVGVA